MILARRRFLELGAGLALIGGQALGQALPPYRFDPANPGSMALARVGTDAMRLKVRALASITGVRDLIAPDVAASLPGLGLLPRDGVDTLWALFFQNAQLFVGHARSATPVVAFFNPIMDLWWVTLWSPDNRRAEAAKLIAGGRLLPGPSGTSEPLPAWRRRMQKVSIVEALRRCGGVGDAEFGKVFAFEAASPPAIFGQLTPAPPRLLADRALDQASAVKTFAATQRAFPSYDVLMNAVSSGIAGAAPLSAEARQAFARLSTAPQAVRKHLSPVAIVRVETVFFVISSTPISGRFVVLSAHRETDTGGAIERLALVDLFGGARA